MSGSTRWLPLESNPDVMTRFARSLGLGEEYSFTDVLGTDPELLAMVPHPVAAVLLLFPCSPSQEEFRHAEQQRLAEAGYAYNPKAFFLKQTIGNACGTVGLIHAIANSLNRVRLGEGFLRSYLEGCQSLSPEERGRRLEEDESITVVHESAAREGQTEAPSLDAQVDLHFVAFAHVDGRLLEFDGRKQFPIDHGATTPDTVLESAVGVAQQFMARDPENVNFTIVALAPTQA